MSGTPSKHWRVGSVSACGRSLSPDFFVRANPEAVTCGNCRRTSYVTSALWGA